MSVSATLFHRTESDKTAESGYPVDAQMSNLYQVQLAPYHRYRQSESAPVWVILSTWEKSLSASTWTLFSVSVHAQS